MEKTKRVRRIPVAPLLISSAIIKRSAALNKFDMRTILRRLNRSRKIPTYGPINEYGRRTTAKAKAALTALGWRSGENKTKEAKAD
jgi:hypothetical protein